MNIANLSTNAVKTGKIALVGNPNVGKSVIFGFLTGRYVTVSNFPGTTVDVSRGQLWSGGQKCELVDTPGILSLYPRSEDERVTRDLLLREAPDLVIQVTDAKNLKRGLLITMELADLHIPMILVLNMSDEARERGIEIDTNRLASTLGIPVVETVAVTGEGMAELRRLLPLAKAPLASVRYLREVEAAFDRIQTQMPEAWQKNLDSKLYAKSRFVAETLLANDESIWHTLERIFPVIEENSRLKAQTAVHAVLKDFLRPIHILTLNSRQQRAIEISGEITQITGKLKSSWAQKLGAWSMRPWPGYLIMSGILYLMYEFVGVFAAQTLVKILEDGLFGKILNPAVTKIVELLLPVPFLQEMIVGPYGLFTMALTYALALIFPIVSAFFLFFGLMEDSGMLPRLAVMLDRMFRVMGLNGKAVLPMILGLGCDTMATLTTRVLDSKKEKIIVALLLTLSVPCSAQLGAMLGMIAGLSWKVFALWITVVISTMFAVGYGASKFIPGARSPFLMEIPPIRIPQISNILKKVRARLVWYLKEAVPMFLLGTFLLFISDKIGLLGIIKTIANPLVVHFLGLTEKSTEAFIIGFLRRDYGAAGFFVQAQNGFLNPRQVTVALIVITLFMPCIAQFFVTIKERGLKTTLAIAGFVMTFSIAVGGLVNWLLKTDLIQL